MCSNLKGNIGSQIYVNQGGAGNYANYRRSC